MLLTPSASLRLQITFTIKPIFPKLYTVIHFSHIASLLVALQLVIFLMSLTWYHIFHTASHFGPLNVKKAHPKKPTAPSLGTLVLYGIYGIRQPRYVL